MEKRNLTCIGCPMGCQITVEFEGEEVFSVKGNTCAIGERRMQTFRRTRSSSAWMRSTKSAPRHL